MSVESKEEDDARWEEFISCCFSGGVDPNNMTPKVAPKES